jgi:hypothetical protein
VKADNAALRDKVLPLPGGAELLKAAGFARIGYVRCTVSQEGPWVQLPAHSACAQKRVLLS